MSSKVPYEFLYAQMKVLCEGDQDEIICSFKKKGVIFANPANVYVSPDAVIGPNTIILPGTMILPGVIIGEGSIIGPSTMLEKSTIGSRVYLNQVQCYESVVEDSVRMGPYVHIRPGSHIKSGVKIGDFVEVKNSVIGEDTSISHLTYVGDSDVGQRVNFGCGTVTVNYDGHKKSRTIIKDDAFIGCNTNLVAPVTVGEKAFTAAGSTITEDVPDYSLAIARSRQENKRDWVKKRG